MPQGYAAAKQDRSDLGRMKGAAFRELLLWQARRGGEEQLKQAALRLRPELRTGLNPSAPALGVLPASWYRAEAVHALLDELYGHLSAEQQHVLAREAAHAVMSRTLSGVYRFLFRVIATPDRYARYGERLWNAHYDSGHVVTERRADNVSVSTVTDWRSHHRFVCELNWGAGEAIYTAMGCREVRVIRETCVALGAKQCRFVMTWRG